MRDMLIARPLHAFVILPLDLIIQHPSTALEDQKQLFSSVVRFIIIEAR